MKIYDIQSQQTPVVLPSNNTKEKDFNPYSSKKKSSVDDWKF